jgi:hypothetical protein
MYGKSLSWWAQALSLSGLHELSSSTIDGLG